MEIKKIHKEKKGYFFSLDAFIALIIILGFILFIKPQNTQTSQISEVQTDFLNVLSKIKIGELNNTYSHSLINGGTITNLNQSVLEQIGEFYASSDPRAETLTSSILNQLNLAENIGLYFNNMEISSSSQIPIGESRNIWTSRQIISGINNNINSSKGYSSRAFLISGSNIKYFYFGGYVGDGNITLNLGEQVTSAKIEASFSGTFSLSVNNNTPTAYVPSSEAPIEIALNQGFVSGNNYLYFTSPENIYIAGGFVKVIYNYSEHLQSQNKYFFPGIQGLINIYDSFYVPGTLNEMEIFLHYNSDYNLFLNIGNTSVYNGNGTNQELTISNSQLNNLLNYATMNDKTIPFRLGLENVSHIVNSSLNADVFSVTDLSGSMASSCSGANFWCCWTHGGCNSQYNCNYCSGTWEDKIGLAKQANNAFIDAVIDGGENNKVGLVGYSSQAQLSKYHALSRNKTSLKNKVASWTARGSTCICCGINLGVDRINIESNESNFRSLVVMSDGQANVECSRQGTDDASQDAIQAACDAAEQGIKVYSVGFGSDADIATLQEIASCGQGSFYYGDINDLIEIYEEIAQEIINATYTEQTIIGDEINTILYPDSYIYVSYNKTIPYGIIITAETPEFGSSRVGNFTFPQDATQYEAKVISYSGAKWTSKADVYNNISGWQTFFDLSAYGATYTELGDPYVIHIPISKTIKGENKVNISLGLNPNNLTDGSQYNKIIYSVIKNVSSFSPIVASAEGCQWTIEFEDQTNETMKIPADYNGTSICSYTSDEISYNNNDAIDYAIYKLLVLLDLNSNGRVETKFNEDDLQIDSTEINGIPFVWETEAQARAWR